MAIILGTGVTRFDIFFAALALILTFRLITRGSVPKGLRLPPGPPGKLIVGNAADFPREQEWRTFSRWANEYGDLVHIKVLGQSMVVINSLEVAYDLFEKRSSIYSDRTDLPMMNDLMGFTWNFAFLRYGNWWRRHRKAFHQKFHPAAVAEYQPIQLKHTRTMLRGMRESPDKFVEHLRHNSGAIIMEVIYGIKVQPKDDPYIITAEMALGAAIIAGNVGAFLVDVLPILKHVPEWMPGAGFQTKARIWRKSITAMSVAPFSAVKQALAAGTAKPSFTSSLLEEASYRDDTPPDEEDVIRGAGSTAFAGGADTSVHVLHNFILAMVLYPEVGSQIVSSLHAFILKVLPNPKVQRKAQEEVDSVLGDRLPEFSDRENLPYINAVCKEILRWMPIVPLGVAHRVMQDDVYGEYFIPKDSVIIGNSWHMLHDESVYGPETEKFCPERFFVPGVRDPNNAFGYGRRICPGRYMADNSNFIAVASLLKERVFDITPALDNNGVEIPVSASFTSGFLSHPETFQCTIRPRSDLAEKLIQHMHIEE